MASAFDTHSVILRLDSPQTPDTRPAPDRRKAEFARPSAGPRIVSVGTATPPNKYTQDQVLDIFQETDSRIRQVFNGGHIETRHLYLDRPADGSVPQETNQELRAKHIKGALEIGTQAIEECLGRLGFKPSDIDFLCVVTSTGLAVPGLTAHIIEEMGFRSNVRRVDIVGMGCNAAMNGLQTASDFARANPDKLALVLCVEICSAAYVYNRNIVTAVVNSLFGDGAAAVLIREDEWDTWEEGPVVADFEPYVIPNTLSEMRYTLEDDKLSFVLARDIPYEIGSNVEKPVNELLKRHGLKRKDIDHWLVHSGGKKVIDGIEYNLGLTDHDMRHTLGVLQSCGNVSSASVLFSYQRLSREGKAKKGDLGVAIAMGPGACIEVALLVW
jgi:alkylresorcinol/alkylpyrone synthase/polyketide synthase Type III